MNEKYNKVRCCVSRKNRKVRGKKWFLLKQVFLVCTQLDSARDGLLPLLASEKSSRLLFPLSEEEGSPALGTGSLGPECAERCRVLPGSQHASWAVSGARSGSKPSAAVVPALLPGHTQQHWEEEGLATRVSLGQFLRCQWS